MSTSSEPRFLDALRAARDALASLNCPSMFIGGVAVIAHGVPRYTVDIDATVLGRCVPPDQLVEKARVHHLVPRRADAIDFAKVSQVVLLRHDELDVPVDISLAWMPFEEEALAASLEVDYQGVRIRVPRPEDLVLYKLVASRTRDVEDAGKLLALHGKSIRVERVEGLLRQFCEVLEDSQRLDTLASLLKKAKLRR